MAAQLRWHDPRLGHGQPEQTLTKPRRWVSSTARQATRGVLTWPSVPRANWAALRQSTVSGLDRGHCRAADVLRGHRMWSLAGLEPRLAAAGHGLERWLGPHLDVAPDRSPLVAGHRAGAGSRGAATAHAWPPAAGCCREGLDAAEGLVAERLGATPFNCSLPRARSPSAAACCPAAVSIPLPLRRFRTRSASANSGGPLSGGCNVFGLTVVSLMASATFG